MKTKSEIDIENEKEWRRLIYSDVQDIKKEVTGLKIKIIGIVSCFGSLFGAFGSFLADFLRHK
jgi:hypothetical protein